MSTRDDEQLVSTKQMRHLIIVQIPSVSAIASSTLKDIYNKGVQQFVTVSTKLINKLMRCIPIIKYK